ncbi:MAG: putative Ig domain-containing protein [Phycisphaerae bacterium]
MNMSDHPALIGFVLLLAAVASVQTPVCKAETKTRGMSLIVVGNSHNQSVHTVASLALLAGHEGYKDEAIRIFGASLNWNWNHPKDNQWPEKLATSNKWDALVLLSWDDKDSVYAPKFATEAYKGNPQCQVYIYTIWPDSNQSFENPLALRTEAHSEEVADAVAAVFPNAPKPRVIPSSLVIREIGRLADRGELPGVLNRFALWSDGGHLSQIGLYAVSTMICAMVYNESPLNYPAAISPPNHDMKVTAIVSEETAAVIKRTVWDILQTYPPAGLKLGLIIAKRRLEAAIAGQPYRAELKALNTNGPCQWALAKGTLPAGITLSANGVLSGQSRAAGSYPVTINVVDGTNSVERSLVLEVCQDIPPTIPDQTLSAVSLDAYVFQPLKATGGVGRITWSVSDGKLPYGIMLSPVGLLSGSPGEEGEFTFKIKAEDSHPGAPRSVEKEFKWKVGPAKPDSLLVKALAIMDKEEEKTLVIDGKLDEPFWKHDQKIAKKVKGTPVKEASFNAIWCYRIHPWSDKMGDGSDLILGIKVLDGPKGRTAKDGVHIFINGRHDHKLIYGADDLHILIPRDFKSGSGWAPIVRGLKFPWFTKVAVAEIEGGYTMEVRLGNYYFQGDGQWLPFGAKGVYGFDIAVDEGEEEHLSQQVWRGDATDADNPSHFGTIVLTSRPADTTPKTEKQ